MDKYSILDQDLYKMTMQLATIQLFPNLFVRYKFINRGKTIWPKGMAERLRERLIRYSEESILTDGEKDYLRTIRFITPFYIWCLSNYRFDPSEINVTDNIDDTTVEGYWWRTILWECVFLSMLSELYYEMTGQKLPDRNVLTKINMTKGYDFYRNDINFVEAGFRRRFSFDNQDNVIYDLKKSAQNRLIGTSNVYFAKKYNLKAIGTKAHEWYMAHSAMFGFHEANRKSLENWIKVYNGDLGVALPDTFTSKAFFSIFDTYFAKLFDGLRQDSGNPIEFGNMALDVYKKVISNDNIIKSKTIIFSDNLNSIEKILSIQKEFLEKILTSYMIGTWLTNDIPGISPLNIVMKLSHVFFNGMWIPVVKLGDGVGKETGDPNQIDLAKRALNLQ